MLESLGGREGERESGGIEGGEGHRREMCVLVWRILTAGRSIRIIEVAYETNREGGTIHQFDLKVCSVLLRIERLIGNASVLFNRITTRYRPDRNAHRRIIASYIDLSIRK